MMDIRENVNCVKCMSSTTSAHRTRDKFISLRGPNSFGVGKDLSC